MSNLPTEEEEEQQQLQQNQPSEDEHYDSNVDEYDEDEEEEETDDDDDDLDEPKLRYRRVGAGVKELLDKDTASTLCVSDKFVVM